MLREAQQALESELDEIIRSGWTGAGVRLDPKTREVLIFLSVQDPSRIRRFLINRGLLKLPPHPAQIRGFKVFAEARPVAYLGGPPPGIIRRLLNWFNHNRG